MNSKMNEEHLALALFQAAIADPAIQLISWQSVDGKGYFTADVKLYMPNGIRVEPDLIVRNSAHLWIIELKSRHSEAIADERKLESMGQALGDRRIIDAIQLSSGTDCSGTQLIYAVAYALDDVKSTDNCVAIVRHLNCGTTPKLLSQLLT